MDKTAFQLIANDTPGISIIQFSFSMPFLRTSQLIKFPETTRGFRDIQNKTFMCILDLGG